MAGLMAVYVLPLLVYEWWLNQQPDLMAFVKSPWLVRGLSYGYAVAMLIIFPPPVAHEFIYFQF
jgi:hypothetical protein